MKIHSDLPVFFPSRTPGPSALRTPGKFFRGKKSYPDSGTDSAQCLSPIQDIHSMGENSRLFRVELTLTNDNDKDLRVLNDHIREESCPNFSGWFRLSEILRRMGQPQKAQQVYEMLSEQETEKRRKAPIYHQLGMMKALQGE